MVRVIWLPTDLLRDRPSQVTGAPSGSVSLSVPSMPPSRHRGQKPASGPRPGIDAPQTGHTGLAPSRGTSPPFRLRSPFIPASSLQRTEQIAELRLDLAGVGEGVRDLVLQRRAIPLAQPVHLYL